jgi:hypothetical protein
MRPHFSLAAKAGAAIATLVALSAAPVAAAPAGMAQPTLALQGAIQAGTGEAALHLVGDRYDRHYRRGYRDYRLSPRRIERKLERSRRYHDVRYVRDRGDRYVFRAETRRGGNARIVADARTGEVIRVDVRRDLARFNRHDRRNWHRGYHRYDNRFLTEERIIRRLTRRGYDRVRIMETRRGYLLVRAYDRSGRFLRLRIDPYEGKVLRRTVIRDVHHRRRH